MIEKKTSDEITLFEINANKVWVSMESLQSFLVKDDIRDLWDSNNVKYKLFLIPESELSEVGK